MTTTIRRTLTDKQKEALLLIRRHDRVLLSGGARSGKTHLLCEHIIHRAYKHPGSRFLVARYRYSHAKLSVWNQTLVPMVKVIFPPDDYEINKSEMFIHLFNDSEIWLGGFDDKERTEKILGTEYLDVYFNEVSQISFDSVIVGLTRLAQKIEGATNKAYFDCNPPSPLHWSHRLFIEGVDPKDNTAVKNPGMYGYLQMNPVDNRQNLPPGYIENNLETLPERARKRFLLGEWVKAEGAIFENLSEAMIEDPTGWPKMEEYTAGVDFGLNASAVLIGWCGDHIYIVDEAGGYNMTASALDKSMRQKWSGDGNGKTRYDYIAYCDPSGGERIQEIYQGTQANNSVEPGLDFVNKKIEAGQFHVSKYCSGWISEAFNYRRDEKERIVKEDDHYCLVGDMMITMDKGHKPLAKVRRGDKVRTRGGIRPVVWAGVTKKNAEVYELTLADGKRVIGTKDHPVWMNGMIPLGEYRKGKIIRRVKDPYHVYNLTVDGEHEYYANGILVANCDAARYGIFSRVGGFVLV
uniref:Putative terminase n=1 Tax=viral metagenome TaxID=1070528 RepID=A0A6M3L680_9ZZZZ